nr:TolC family protein [Pseudomonadota bacterium]
MVRLYRLVLSGLLAAAGSQAAAAAGLLEVYRQAADSDPQLKAARADLLAVREAGPQARALYLPNVNASAEEDYNFNLHSPGPNDPNFQDNSISVSLSQPIYRRGALVQIRQAESVVERAEADYLVAEQDLILRVAQAYFNVLSAADTLGFREAENDAISRQLDQAQRRFEVGLITITDVHEAQARFDLSESDVIAAQNDLADAREALREITGQYYESLARLTDRMPLRLPDPSNPDVWAEQALTANPQLISAAFGVEVARENIEFQRSGHYPTLDVVAGYFNTDT